MGARYISRIDCPKCGSIEEVYYAPTCDFTTHKCSGCGYVIELAEYVDTEPVRGIERLQERGIINVQEYADLAEILEAVATVPGDDFDRGTCDARIIWITKALDRIANEVCDLLDWRDQIEGQMDNPEYPDVEERITERLKNTKSEGV